jgi:hypothetical protein
MLQPVPAGGSMSRTMKARWLHHYLTRRALLSASLAWSSAWAQTVLPKRMSKRQAGYQDQPKDVRMCATCTLFKPPRSCAVVEGDISPNGWCTLFALAD